MTRADAIKPSPVGADHEWIDPRTFEDLCTGIGWLITYHVSSGRFRADGPGTVLDEDDHGPILFGYGDLDDEVDSFCAPHENWAERRTAYQGKMTRLARTRVKAWASLPWLPPGLARLRAHMADQGFVLNHRPEHEVHGGTVITRDHYVWRERSRLRVALRTRFLDAAGTVIAVARISDLDRPLMAPARRFPAPEEAEDVGLACAQRLRADVEGLLT